MIYLDNAGTTQMLKECAEVYSFYACQDFYNPSAVSKKSAYVYEKLDKVREQVLKKLGATKGTVVFTGGATESNNLAIKGCVRNGKNNYVFSSGEHPSVYNVAKGLELAGKDVRFVKLTKDGQIDLTELKKVVDADTRLISCMLVNNETGAINDIKGVARIRDRVCPKALLHVDAVQGFEKIPFSVENLKIDLLSFSAHKFYGPKGVGGLYIRDMSSVKNIVDGGNQEFGLRSGTENVAGIMAMAKALEIVDVEKNYDHVSKLKKILNDTLASEQNIKILDCGGSPYIEVLIFKGVKGETMLHSLEARDVIVGLGSACSAKKAGNRILKEMGISNEDILSSCRVSFSAYLTEKEVMQAGKIILDCYKKLKEAVG